MPATIFFADTHLNVSQPEKTVRVLRFLRSQPSDTTFYILGDFFDLWIGPKHIELNDYKEIFETLKALTSQGMNINLIPGNRDFTVGPEISTATNIKLLQDITEITIDNKKILLTHGDIFCTEDRSYQNYRRLSRTRIAKSVYRSLPSSIGRRLAENVRNYSEDVVPQKPPISRNIIDSVLKRYFKKSYDVIICGHIHKPTRREVLQGKTLFTVGSWEDRKGSYVEYQNGEFVLKEVV
ncbi:MAG: UDP-2,3-diacylglucosamine diphosphatase [Planctomycetota bacterium]|nr:UDP-2,3-diacylglucosamine diphosphatase [Planctomycetota bacterium]MDI6787221.1 UDP-2,3-diacylglucosamine diphosphatase [Planctomycetota bacterium]